MTAERVDLSGFEPKVVYTHNSDLDGVVCAMIARDRFPDVPIVALDYRELDQVTEAPCLVLDLNLPAEHPLVAPRLEEPGPELIGHDGEARQPGRVVIVDHHRADWYPPWLDRAVLFGYAALGPGDAIRLFHHAQRSAAAIALDVLLPESRARGLVAWTVLADMADLWLEKKEGFAQARALTAVVHQAGFDFCLDAWLGMLPSDPRVAGMAQAAAAAEKRANEGALQAAIASMTEGEDHVLGLCIAGSVSHVAQGVLEHRRKAGEAEKPVALVILQSLLGEKDVVAVGVRGPGALEIAQRYGGGGHPESAGFEVPALEILDSVRRNVWIAAEELRVETEDESAAEATAEQPRRGDSLQAQTEHHPAESGESAAKDPGPPAVGAFAGLEVGSRLILIRDAGAFAKQGDEVEVVAMLQPGDADGAIRVANDGIRVRRVDGSHDREVQFMWDCGRRYFASDGGGDA